MTESLIKEATVAAEYYGQRVDVVLAQLFPDYSRSQLTNWLKEGSITLNQRQCKPKDKLCGGEHISMHVVFNEENGACLAEDIPLHVVFEDEHILIINKPSGLVVHPGAGNSEHTLILPCIICPEQELSIVWIKKPQACSSLQKH